MSSTQPLNLKNNFFIFPCEKVIPHLDNRHIYRVFETGYNILPCPIEEADTVVFVAPSSLAVHPFLMKQPVIREYEILNLSLDLRWYAFYKKYKYRKSFVGIGKGAVFLNLANGGKFWQYQDNHRFAHNLVYNGVSHPVNSDHTQGMEPREHDSLACKHLGLSWVSTRKENHRYSRAGATPTGKLKDFEVLFYPDTKSLCFQPYINGGEDLANITTIQLLHKIMDEHL